MNKIEELQHLKELHKNLKEFESIECKDNDVKVIELAIERVEKEVREQQQLRWTGFEKAVTENEKAYFIKIENVDEKIKFLEDLIGNRKRAREVGYCTNYKLKIAVEQMILEEILEYYSGLNIEIPISRYDEKVYVQGKTGLENVSTDDLATELSKRQGIQSIEKIDKSSKLEIECIPCKLEHLDGVIKDLNGAIEHMDGSEDREYAISLIMFFLGVREDYRRIKEFLDNKSVD